MKTYFWTGMANHTYLYICIFFNVQKIGSLPKSRQTSCSRPEPYTTTNLPEIVKTSRKTGFSPWSTRTESDLRTPAKFRTIWLKSFFTAWYTRPQFESLVTLCTIVPTSWKRFTTWSNLRYRRGQGKMWGYIYFFP